MKKFYQKHQELLNYLFFGVLTTLVNWVIHALFRLLVPASGSNSVLNTVGTVIAWICAALFAFFTYKKWVFRNDDWAPGSVFRQMITFFGSRALTLGTDALLAFTLTEPLDNWGFLKSLPLVGDKKWLPFLVLKVLQAAVNMVVNYITSKFLVFRKKKEAPQEAPEDCPQDTPAE